MADIIPYINFTLYTHNKKSNNTLIAAPAPYYRSMYTAGTGTGIYTAYQVY